MNELERWANFHLLMSAAAATLLGLMFVVITLAAERRQGDAAKIREASIKAVTRSLRLSPSRWTPDQLQSLENWSLILALIPDLDRWSPREKRDLIRLIQAQSASNEMRYLRLTQQHARLRQQLLRLGSNP